MFFDEVVTPLKSDHPQSPLEVRSGILTIDPDGAVAADTEAVNLLGPVIDAAIETQGLAGPYRQIQEMILKAIGDGEDTPPLRCRLDDLELKTPDASPLGVQIDARRVGAMIVVRVDERPAIAPNLCKEGAIAVGLEVVRRQAEHDLRGLLNGISLNLTLLGRAVKGELEQLANAQERQEEWVQAVSDSLGGLARLADQADRLSMRDSRDQQDRVLDLRSTLGHLDTVLSPVAQRRGVDLEIQHPQEPVNIESPHDIERMVVAMTAALVAELSEEDRLCLHLRVDDDRAILTLEGVKPVDEDASKQVVAGRRTTVAEGLLHELEADVSLGVAGEWTVTWPMAPDPSDEQRDDDD